VGGIGTGWMSAAFGWLPRASEQLGPLSSAAHFYNGLTHDPRYQFYFFRFLLGFFEGGFFPSVIVYIALWFRREDRAKAIAGFALAMPLSSVFGSPISGWLLRADWFGVVGWRWVFIVEGVVPILAGVATIFLLPNRPGDVRWLADDERTWLAAELDRERLEKKENKRVGWRTHLLMVLLLTAVYFCTNVTAYGLSTFMPSLFKQSLNGLPFWLQSWLGLTDHAEPAALEARRNLVASYLTCLPYLVAVAVLLFNGRHSDRKRERIWHAAVPMMVISLGIFTVWALAGWQLAAIMVLIFVVGGCAYTYIPPFWSIPTMFLGSGAAASAIGFINMTGNLGGSVGPYLLGRNSTKTDIWTALIYVAPWSFGGALILLGMDAFRRHKEALAQTSKP
jgi:ACS family tartrate transporter-like MFS transporter